MTKNKRGHIRHPLSASIKISHPTIGEKIVKTKNVSDSGLFLLVEPTEMPPMGEIIQGQIQGIEDAPVVQMVIVRTEKEGLGLRFIESFAPRETESGETGSESNSF